MIERGRRHLALARVVSSAVTSQILLSAASFAIGLILIRRTSDAQYGYYMLASTSILLLASLQNALFNPPLANRVDTLDAPGRSALVGGLYREQRRIVRALCAVAAVGGLALWFSGVLEADTGPIVLATVVATAAALHREYFRMVFFAHRNSHEVLRSDVVYATLIVAGVALATLTAIPAVMGIVALGLAAVTSGVLLSRRLRVREPWDTKGVPDILRDIAPLGMWSVSGAAIHWTFSQGYLYVVAGTLDLGAVAAIAGTRLLLMPVHLLSMGMGPLLLPLASSWLHRHGRRIVLGRLSILAAGVAAATLCYFAVLWFLRDWIFAVVLKKQFDQSDALLMLWGFTFLMTAVRGQLAYLLAAEGRFRFLTTLTFVSALVALAASYVGMVRFGVAGAVAGVLLGESINTIGIVAGTWRKSPRALVAPA